MLQSSHQDTGVLSPLVLSFLAGAVSSTLICWTLRLGRDDDQPPSWMRRSISSVEDITSRIGELPSRASKRCRWPWDKTKHRSHQVEDEGESGKPRLPSTPVRVQDKTGPCIGSIFGLDVGGTLAKLVYFEQSNMADELPASVHREQAAYHRAASAQVVLEAHKSPIRKRTSSEDLSSFAASKMNHSREIDEDLQDLYRLRQESVPAHLSEYGSVRDPAPKTLFMPSLGEGQTEDEGSKQNGFGPRVNGFKRTRSMVDMSSSRDHAEALDRFYTFARRLDTYETAVKDKELSFYSRELGGELHFIRFETRRMHNAMDLIRVNNLHLHIVTMGATGGGAHKYASDWDQVLGIKMDKQEELDSLVAGMQFVLSTVIGECYTFRPDLEKDEKEAPKSTSSDDSLAGMPLEGSENSDLDEKVSDKEKKLDDWWWSRKVQRDVASSMYPYLTVTIGTGVSILRVDGPRKHIRVSGSTIGGGTYWGLIRLLTDVENFEDAMSLAERGDPSKVDLLVGDIYGKNPEALEKLGLPANLVASSFGKLVAKQDPASDLKQEDLARALLLMITINIGQVAYLSAQLHKTNRIYFIGNFLRNNSISQRRLSFAIHYWSKGEMEALFLEHEGYFGALGAFLLSQNVSHTPDEPEPISDASDDESVLEGYFGTLKSAFLKRTVSDSIHGSDEPEGYRHRRSKSTVL